MRLLHSRTLCLLLPICMLIYSCGHSSRTLFKNSSCSPDFGNAIEQLELNQNPALLKNIQESAARGDEVGLSCLAYLHLMGWGVEGNEEKAWELFQKSAQEGNAAAMHEIGTMYELGKYVEKDYKWAMLWHLRSAVRDHAHAQSTVGIFYEDGLAGHRDVTAALFWYKKAAAQGEPFAIEAPQRLEKTVVTTDD